MNSLFIPRTITLIPSSLPFLPTISPKLTISKVPIHCKNDEIDMPRKKSNNNSPMKNPRKKRSSYGTSRRSVIKKSFNQEQVEFKNVVSSDPVVGIIGGGMSGLMCALHLEKRGISSTVFDTGIHGLGGRLGTRIVDPDRPLIFDHACQFFTVSDPKFAEIVDAWSNNGLVSQWHGEIGEVEAGGHFVPYPKLPPKYIGVNGMRSLADSMLSQASMVNVVRPCWVSKVEPYNGRWYLSENGKPCGNFDAIVIAHNGKCANKLLSTSGLPLIAQQMKRLDLSPIWALLAAFEDPLPVSFEGAFIKGVDSVSWMGNNTTKLSGAGSSGSHCWTFLSTAAFAKQNKVPQESIPNITAEKVKEAMLEGVEIALGQTKGSLKKPFYSRVQLWGAALPTNTPSIPCIFDSHGRAGICGDWLLGSSLESAALSGIALANHMADYFQSGGVNPDEFAVGLQNDFEPLDGQDIGQFPGLDSKAETSKAAYDMQLASS